MSSEHLQIDQTVFLRHIAQHAPQIMWFLGAGTPRSSGLPTAHDLIWDLKRRYYCAKENQDAQAHKLSNHAIRARIQDYFENKGCPEEWNHEEYTYYFDLMFGEDHGAQQSYIHDQMSPDKVTLTIGQRVFASLIEMRRARLVFTTNFDNVIETAYAAVTNKNLSAYHIDGSYAALDALNAEQFPIYAKVHGDFRYRSIKNLSKDLLHNDAELQKCFVAGAGRYGVVVAGYSGRDANVMSMFETALAQANPFPHGIWWTTPRASGIIPIVKAFIKAARDKGVEAHIVETGPFDVMMSKIWRQFTDKPQALDEKVRTARTQFVSIELPKTGTAYPILRTNALEIMNAPRRCGEIAADGIAAAYIIAAVNKNKPDAVVSYQDGIIFWGEPEEVAKGLVDLVGKSAIARDIANPIAAVAESTYLKSFYEYGIAKALCQDKPVMLRKRGRDWYAVVDYRQADDTCFVELKNAVGFRQPGPICGAVREVPDTFYAEAVRLRLDERTGVIWLLLEPDVWIKPLAHREKAQEFLRARKLKRYNNKSYEILNAWINILIGPVGQGAPNTVTYAPNSDYPAEFTISTRTAFSKRGAA